jgi:hypothetical protein
LKINFRQVVKALDGSDRKDPKGNKFLLRDACIIALDNTGEEEAKKLEPKEKYRRGDLARRIYGAKEPFIVDAEDIALLRALVAKVYVSNIVVADVWDLLDPKDKTGSDDKPQTPSPRIPKKRN